MIPSLSDGYVWVINLEIFKIKLKYKITHRNKPNIEALYRSTED